ncbi:hypothetical protein GEMRC1_012155 [Eukaryota sp. GEM-RC1]
MTVAAFSNLMGLGVQFQSIELTLDKSHISLELQTPMIEFFLLSNKQGQPRLSQFYRYLPMAKRIALQTDIVRECLKRDEHKCSILHYNDFKVVYRRYASLFFIVGIDAEENELAILEFIHNLVEVFDAYFESVRELHIMHHVDKAHFILDEMVQQGRILETNKQLVIEAVKAFEVSHLLESNESHYTC